MLCLVLVGPSFREAREQLFQALPFAGILELRLDYFDSVTIAQVRDFLKESPLPVILTLRSKFQGGKFLGTEEERLSLIEQLASLHPAYLDLEYGISLEYINKLRIKHPKTKILLSFHDFEKTPEDLEGLFHRMKDVPADLYKIATIAHSPNDAMRTLILMKNSEKKLVAMNMGEWGHLARILSPVLETPFTYACLDEKQATAAGQLAAQTLLNIYRFDKLNSKTHIYGLIGDPVEKSISDRTHNAVMKALDLNAVYVKIRVPEEELAWFLAYIKELPFYGLSVTMPLKESVMAHIDSIDPFAQRVGAVNTLVIQRDTIRGYNTDARGALDALEQKTKVSGKKIAILGAGGAAKAIAWEAKQRGSQVRILNRDTSKAEKLAEEFGYTCGGLDHLNRDPYDIIINTTPNPLPINAEELLKGSDLMDITTNPKDTLFVQEGIKKECRITYGYEMFVHQAVGQYKLWLGDHLDFAQVQKILSKTALDILGPV